ncbi:hypothetical protein EWM64_g7256 [Hericium alpestre]|uniref:No apical meristem-associated C-terminal domain-containing protein n=1 Tax=Hericium alpestre TaxID=135208 RepID=A0A4Y9ZQ84_9AGAM|nr:hypothetical protein EWM64_g7256 [Hericium alpestre]
MGCKKATPKPDGIKEAPTRKSQRSAGDDRKSADEADGGRVHVEWDDDFSKTLLAAITDNPAIKQGLFPSPGANVSTTNGGDKGKAEFHCQLASMMFSTHPKFADKFALANTPKLKTVWANKIKNRLRNMVDTTTAYMAELGETGSGLSKEDLIQDPDIANRRAAINEECPWYEDMHALIAEHPNRVPIGLGNSTTAVDESVMAEDNDLSTHDESTDDGGSETEEVTTKDQDLIEVEVSSDSDDHEVTLTTKLEPDITTHTLLSAPNTDVPISSTLAKCKLKTEAAKPKPAVINHSAAKLTPRPVKKTKVREFADVAQAMETTEQEKISLKKARLEREKAKIEKRAAQRSKKWEYKQEKLRVQASITKLKMEQAHAIEMAKMQLGGAGGSSSSREASAAIAQPPSMMSMFDGMFEGGDAGADFDEANTFMGFTGLTGHQEGGV